MTVSLVYNKQIVYCSSKNINDMVLHLFPQRTVREMSYPCNESYEQVVCSNFPEPFLSTVDCRGSAGSHATRQSERDK